MAKTKKDKMAKADNAISRNDRRAQAAEVQREEGQRTVTVKMNCANGPHADELIRLITNCVTANLAASDSAEIAEK